MESVIEEACSLVESDLEGHFQLDCKPLQLQFLAEYNSCTTCAATDIADATDVAEGLAASTIINNHVCCPSTTAERPVLIHAYLYNVKSTKQRQNE